MFARFLNMCVDDKLLKVVGFKVCQVFKTFELTEFWAENRLTELGELASGMKHLKALFRRPSKKLCTALLNLESRQLRLAVALVTGHGLTGKHF